MNLVRKLQYQIEQKDDGKSIGQFLRDRKYSTAVLSVLKKTQAGIKKNGKWAWVNETLHTGDLLEICLTEEEASQNIKPVKGDLTIIYEDEDILVVNKPADMPIHPSINNYDNTLANRVAAYYKAQNVPFVFRCMNRLDRDTSGVTIIAKHLLSAAVLSKQMETSRIKRTYIALVEGLTEKEGVIEAPIGREEGSLIKRKVDLDKGKRAITSYRRLKAIRVSGQDVSMIALQLETGRTHQIRVHMAYIGHPLLGDFLYNAHNHMLTRQALHAAEICFYHPISGEYMKLSAKLPKDIQDIIEDSKNKGDSI